MGDFSVKLKDRNEVSIIQLSGYLDAHTAPEFEKALQQLVDADKVRIVVNLSDLDYISSAGLGVFMGFIEDVREKGGDIKLAEASEKVFRVFDLLGFPVLYEIFDEEGQAVDRYRSESAS